MLTYRCRCIVFRALQLKIRKRSSEEGSSYTGYNLWRRLEIGSILTGCFKYSSFGLKKYRPRHIRGVKMRQAKNRTRKCYSPIQTHFSSYIYNMLAHIYSLFIRNYKKKTDEKTKIRKKRAICVILHKFIPIICKLLTFRPHLPMKQQNKWFENCSYCMCNVCEFKCAANRKQQQQNLVLVAGNTNSNLTVQTMEKTQLERLLL